jgi:hypothetical protein
MTVIFIDLCRHNVADKSVGKGYICVISLDYVLYKLDKSVRRV